MNKDPESWARVNPQAVADGSRMQAVNVMQMAIEDIRRMAAEIERLRAELRRWEGGPSVHISEGP